MQYHLLFGDNYGRNNSAYIKKSALSWRIKIGIIVLRLGYFKIWIYNVTRSIIIQNDSYQLFDVALSFMIN